MQTQVQHLTRAGLLNPAAVLQDDLRTTLAELAQRTRPGTRPAQLLGRAARAMAIADLFSNARNCVASCLPNMMRLDKLWALLEEIEVQQNQNGSSNNNQPPPQGQQQQQQPQDGNQPPPQANDQQQGQDAEGDQGGASSTEGNNIADGSGEGGGGNGDVDSTNPEEALMHHRRRTRPPAASPSGRTAAGKPAFVLRFLELLEAQR